MNCKRAKQEMALCAGRDLDECAEQQLRRHLSACPDCRDQWQRIQASTQLLQRAAEADPPVGEVRLWSGVSAALDQVERERAQVPAVRTPLWIPAVAIAALVMAAISMFHTLSAPPEETADVDFRIAPSPAPAVDDGRTRLAPDVDRAGYTLDQDGNGSEP